MMNSKRFYHTLEKTPIVRDVEKQRYWIHEDLLKVKIGSKFFNIAHAVIDIINEYIIIKMAAFKSFIETCEKISYLGTSDHETAINFIRQQLNPNVDARIFEIVSYAVLKAKYGAKVIWIGEARDTVEEHNLILYKTGRTNANDGGIDFVMKPLGRFFQVTETIDASKYFLDIDKVQKVPISFVIKTDLDQASIKKIIREQAVSKYKIEAVVNSYMNAIEEIININDLLVCF